MVMLIYLPQFHDSMTIETRLSDVMHYRLLMNDAIDFIISP